MWPTILRSLKRAMDKSPADFGWGLIDEFERGSNATTASFAGGTFMALYADDPTTQMYLTIPSSKGDYRADWTILSPNATFYPGKHGGHLIFSRDFPFKEPSVYWDTPLLSPFPREGRFSGDISEIWSPVPRSLLKVVETMASLILRSPKNVEKWTIEGQFNLHVLPKPHPRKQFWRDLPCSDEDWFQQCTQFFCRAFTRIDADLDEGEQEPQDVAITDHHRLSSCRAIDSFIEHVLVDLWQLDSTFMVDGLLCVDYFAKVDTMAAWLEGERKWANMLDRESGWMVSQDKGAWDKNKVYHM